MMPLERVIRDLESHCNDLPDIRESLVDAVFYLYELRKWRKNPFKMIKDECLKYPDSNIDDEGNENDEIVCAGCPYHDICHLYLDDIPEYWEWDTKSWEEVFKEDANERKGMH